MKINCSLLISTTVGKITSEQTIQRNSHDICTNPIDISLISETIDTSLISETIDTRLSSEALDTSLISATIDNSLISDIIDSSLISERSDDYYEVDRLFRQQQQPTGDSIGPLEGYFKIMLLHQPKDN